MAKTELEEAGEDTEGMVESTAKLRDLIKGISGIDIMIDENTFKSTYQIIDELGRVWKDINDIDQAAILEAIAGKRQSNIVAATLNNYERLEEILRISKDSAGSAMKEQQEYAKSIQYSLDRAKAAYQGLAQTIVDSDVLKYLVDMSAALLTNVNAIFSVSGLLKDNAFVSLGGFVNSFFENENRIDNIVENMRVLSKDAELFAEDFTTVNKIIEEYGNIINSSNYNKSDLVKLQDDLIASFGEEAKSIDIVNGKYKDVILSINELVSIKYQDWLEENAHIVELAEKYSNMYVDWEWNPGDELFEIKNVSKDLRDIISNIEGVNAFEGFLSDDILFTGNIRDVKNELDELIKSYDNYESKDDLTLNKLKERQKVLSEIIGYIDTYSQQNALKELSDIESEIVEKNIDITKTIYGNIDTNNRQVLKWTDENLLKYKNAIESWGMSTEELAGDISTILGSYGNYDNIDIAFSPILQTPDGAVLLSRDTVDKYIFGLIEQAGEGWTDEELFRLDTKGIEVDGIKIKNIIAEVGDAAEKTSEAMHYVGSSGALALAKQKAGLKSLSESSEGSVLYNLKAIKEETDNLSNTWFETLDKAQKESFKTISNVKTLLQSVAEGDMLSGDDFWNLVKIDTDNIIKDVELVNDKFKVSENQLIQLKDIYIQKQIDSIKADNADLEIKKQQTDEKSKQAELDLQVIGRRGLSNASYRQQYEYTKNALAEAKQSSKEYAETINRNKILIRQLNSELGDTVDRQKALSEQMKKLQDRADKYAKAMTDAVQNVIGGLEDEKQQLEDEKQILDDQLDVLNERKESIEETIEQYKSLAGIVKDVTDAEIDALKEQQQAEEDAIQARIDALKEQHDMQEEENSLAKKQLELRQKIANLDKARSTKVRTFSAERGWHFDVDKESVAKAESELNEFIADVQEEYYDIDVKSHIEELKNNILELNEIESEIASKNIDINQTIFGNIDTNNRQILEWTEDNLAKYKSAYKSWGYELDELADSISTVMGASSEFDGVEIAFSPILQTENGAVLLDEHTVSEYIWGLIDKAGENWKSEDLLKLDTQGLELDGQIIKNLIADIGETAIKTGEAMHYTGSSGALALAKQAASLENFGGKKYNDQIKSLEAEKKAIAKNYEAEIKSYEDYYKEWSDITEEQSKAEEEQLAQQILGSDWREKIKAKDSNALAKFASDFRGYNAQLNSLVNGEIASLKKSIEAKEDEINAKNKQIDAWKRYKTQVEDTIDNITNKYKDYTDALGAATAAEGDSYETREEKLRNFATQYESLIGEINGYQSQIEGLTIPVYLDDKDAREKIGTLLDDYANAMSDMSRVLEDTPRSMHKWVDDLRNIYGFSQGGVADFTGVTTVHGTKQRSEIIFNASQSKELYDMVKSGSFVNIVADKAYAGLSSAISKMSSTTDNSNRVININGLTIKADNPMQFHNQFMKEIGQYWNVKLTEVRTR